MEFNKVTEPKKTDGKADKSKITNAGPCKASDDPRIKDSTDESSDEGLKTSSSVKSSDPNSDDQLKRKKCLSSPNPSSDSSVIQEDKKLRLASESDNNSEKKITEDETEKVI